MSYASVAVPVPVRRLFTYEVGEALRDRMRIGARVRVPFGPRKLVGTVVDWPTDPPEAGVEPKAIEAVVADTRKLPASILELTRFVADYYLCSWGEAIEAALPPDPGQGRTRRFVWRLQAARPAELADRAVAQRRVLDALPEDGAPVPLGSLPTGSRKPLSALARRGWVGLEDRPLAGAGRELPEPATEPAPGPRPTAGQAAVLEQIRPALGQREFAPMLLYGATGSGKTEIYFQAAEQVLGAGRGVLYLVPEIGLTPLLLSKVSARFPGRAAVLHSGLSRHDRFAAWERLRSGRCRFAIGTRSAVFAPLQEIGLIVVDEEQDGSYKQGETPRYNGRDLALVRARAEGAVVLLGSATPSMESFQHARAGRYRLLRLGGRVDRRPLAGFRMIDMRDEYRSRGEVRPLSTTLVQAMRACVERGEQAMVLRNRRGWAAALFCPSCGDRVSCEHCSIAMTWHRAEARLRCHYCNFELPRPNSCGSCGADELKMLGEGTERVEEAIREAVPGARVERMDRDTIRRRGAHEALLRRFEGGEIDILVGTQMIAKGHDFPRVTLVGVLSADQSLGIPDFRAGERTFQLLTQVAGRAGRGERPGVVVAQAFDPDHPVIRLAATQDYESFFDREIRYRRTLRYPPLTGLVQLLIQHRDPYRARDWAENLAEALRDSGGGRLLLAGPGPAPLARLKGLHRQQILVRSAGRRRLVDAVDHALGAVEGRVPRRAVVVDVDPTSLL